MNRRRFFATLAAAAVGTALDPERLLWTPGKVTHILPPAGGWRKVAPLAFRKDAFALTMAPLPPAEYWYNPVKAMADHVDQRALDHAYGLLDERRRLVKAIRDHVMCAPPKPVVVYEGQIRRPDAITTQYPELEPAYQTVAEMHQRIVTALPGGFRIVREGLSDLRIERILPHDPYIDPDRRA
jgi:hypothetical protein